MQANISALCILTSCSKAFLNKCHLCILKKKKKATKPVSISYTHHMDKSPFLELVIWPIDNIQVGKEAPTWVFLQENTLIGGSMVSGRSLILDTSVCKQNIPFISMPSVNVLSYDVVTEHFPHYNSEFFLIQLQGIISSASCQGYRISHILLF